MRRAWIAGSSPAPSLSQVSFRIDVYSHKGLFMLDFLGDLKRTHMCGELRASDAGSKVVLMGWVNRRRDLGNLIFLDLRDRTGMTQVVVTSDAGAAHDKAAEVRSEFVVAVIGHVKPRDP